MRLVRSSSSAKLRVPSAAMIAGFWGRSRAYWRSCSLTDTMIPPSPSLSSISHEKQGKLMFFMDNRTNGLVVQNMDSQRAHTQAPWRGTVLGRGLGKTHGERPTMMS